MPRIVPQNMKSINYVNLQPERMTSRIHNIVMLDIAGMRNGDIARTIGLTESRVSIIRNSPMFVQERGRKWQELQDQFIDKRSDALASGDPVENQIKKHCLEAVNTKITLMRVAKSEFVKSSAADSLLDRGGYRSHTEKTKVTVELTDKMADRFERVLGYEPGSDAKTKVKIEHER